MSRATVCSKVHTVSAFCREIRVVGCDLASEMEGVKTSRAAATAAETLFVKRKDVGRAVKCLLHCTTILLYTFLCSAKDRGRKVT